MRLKQVENILYYFIIRPHNNVYYIKQRRAIEQIFKSLALPWGRLRRVE